jgi:oligopeptide/dipeptide ABC transporter ATP-binding protein
MNRSTDDPIARSAEPLLAAAGLVKRYPSRRAAPRARSGSIRAVDGVSFVVRQGETLGLVGESGSGKTTVARLLLRFEDPTAGTIAFDGKDWLALSGRALRRARQDMQVVFQDPQTSLNPRMRAGDQIAEPLAVQGLAPRRQRPARVAELLAEVGLPAGVAARFPSELSGGQRQRVAIARALATRPKFLVCDEPVSALDVSVAAQIVNLFLDLREKTGLASLFISHDLAVVARVSDRIAVMSLGRIVEEGPAAAVTTRPLHPYTAALLSAVLEPDPASLRRRIVLPGEPPSPAAIPPGCSFHPRCPIARPRCREETPELAPVGNGRSAACFFPGELAPAP